MGVGFSVSAYLCVCMQRDSLLPLVPMPYQSALCYYIINSICIYRLAAILCVQSLAFYVYLGLAPALLSVTFPIISLNILRCIPLYYLCTINSPTSMCVQDALPGHKRLLWYTDMYSS